MVSHASDTISMKRKLGWWMTCSVAIRTPLQAVHYKEVDCIGSRFQGSHCHTTLAQKEPARKMVSRRNTVRSTENRSRIVVPLGCVLVQGTQPHNNVAVCTTYLCCRMPRQQCYNRQNKSLHSASQGLQAYAYFASLGDRRANIRCSVEGAKCYLLPD